MVTVDEIAEAAHRVMVDRPVRVNVLRVGPALAYELHHEFRVPGITEAGPIGLDLVVDEYLPHGVWRLCDADQTLLYDCREGKQV